MNKKEGFSPAASAEQDHHAGLLRDFADVKSGVGDLARRITDLDASRIIDAITRTSLDEAGNMVQMPRPDASPSSDVGPRNLSDAEILSLVNEGEVIIARYEA